MEEIIEIKQNDIVKYRKSIYLVKGFQKLENGRYLLKYYYRSIKKDTAILHSNESNKFYAHSAEYIKKASLEEKKSLISKIKDKHPNFDLSFLIKEITLDLNIDDCIEFLKSKGYIIYKQI